LYWLLLLYVIAALTWWYIHLNQQVNTIINLSEAAISPIDTAYKAKLAMIEDYKRRKKSQYNGEGIIFLAVILVGAMYVLWATVRQGRLSRMQSNFMMAVTHELKTPIAIARLNLETLRKRRLDENTHNKLLDTTLHETDRLNELCNNILMSSRLESSSRGAVFQPVSLNQVCRQCQKQVANRYPSHRILLQAANNELMAPGEEVMLTLMISNLLENAVKYSPQGEEVVLNLVQQGKDALISVADKGPGVPEDEKERIFDKFYRTGNENTRTTKGTGLGLYLCRQIARYHKGQILVKDNIPAGSIFTVSLPLA
jgi:signal transduction histidine kinase